VCIVKLRAKAAALLLLVSAFIASAQSAPEGRSGAQETQVRGYWIDSSTGLTWAGKDNGRDVSWKKAMKYCRDLRLAGYSDWNNHYKFTGKERDAESGLDYFGARYYGSSMGRFTSPDPKGISIRHLLNPQKFNKYAYVLNNPLNMVDPNGLEEITITYRTFIPQQSVTVLGQHFGGDNRGFSTAANASSRTSITVRIETDPSIRANPIISVTSTAGASTKLDANGNVVKTATATTGLPTATGTRDANGNAVINIQQDTKNPLSPAPQFMTPGISANLNVTVPQDASSATVNGTASQFPAQELNVTRADGNTTAVEQISPAAGATPFSLLKPDAQVNATKQTPQCSTDSNGKKVCN
jgi:RHS repeat-associated protein